MQKTFHYSVRRMYIITASAFVMIVLVMTVGVDEKIICSLVTLRQMVNTAAYVAPELAVCGWDNLGTSAQELSHHLHTCDCIYDCMTVTCNCKVQLHHGKLNMWSDERQEGAATLRECCNLP